MIVAIIITTATATTITITTTITNTYTHPSSNTLTEKILTLRRLIEPRPFHIH